MIDTREMDNESAMLDFLVKALTNKLTKGDKLAAVDYLTGVIIKHRAERSKRVRLFKRKWMLPFKEAAK
jgi:hypothetical protein